MLLRYFQSYDFRFKEKENFVKELTKLSLLSKKVYIAYDGSKKGKELYKEALELFPNYFKQVIFLNIQPSPVLQVFSPLSIQFTASHLTKKFYGAKVFYKNLPISKREIRRISKKNVKRERGALLKGSVEKFFEKLKPFSINCRKKINLIGGKSLETYKKFLKKYFRVKVRKKIKKNEINFVFDYDGDRMEVYYKRKYFSFEVAYAISNYLKKIGTKKIVIDSLSSEKYVKMLKSFFKVYRSKVGIINVIRKMIKVKAQFGFELSNHYYFSKLNYSSNPLPVIFGICSNLDKLESLEKIKFVHKRIKGKVNKKWKKFLDCYIKKNGKLIKVRKSNTEKGIISYVEEIIP